MMERPYDPAWTPAGMVARVRLRGAVVTAAEPGHRLQLAEREAPGLTGLLPEAVSMIGRQNVPMVRTVTSCVA